MVNLDSNYINSPHDIFIDAQGKIYFTETDNNRIGVIIPNFLRDSIKDNNGNLTSKITNQTISENISSIIQKSSNIQSYNFVKQWGTNGTNNGQFSNWLEGIAGDSTGNVYVDDIGNNRIQKFDSNGKFVTKFIINGTNDGFPVTINSISVDQSDNVYVADYNHDNIQKFDSNGNLISHWGNNGTGNGQFNGPYGIAVDSSSNVYVADSGNNRIQKFDSNGNFITKWNPVINYTKL
jgi:streptogramin lyase